MTPGEKLRQILNAMADMEESLAPTDVEVLRNQVIGHVHELSKWLSAGGAVPVVKREFDYRQHPGPPFVTERITKFEVVDD